MAAAVRRHGEAGEEPELERRRDLGERLQTKEMAEWLAPSGHAVQAYPRLDIDLLRLIGVP